MKTLIISAVQQALLERAEKIVESGKVQQLSDFSNFLMRSRYLLVHLQAFCSHSAFEEPRGTSTVWNEPGVRDITTCSVTP
jgi:hypothetical protein